MALTPDTPNEAFLREVDENLRRDQMQDFAKRYGKWLVAALVLFLVAVGGWLYWQDRQRAEAARQSEELLAIYNASVTNPADAANWPGSFARLRLAGIVGLSLSFSGL